ncbi:MAG: AMP-binding protein, partial [Myxococcota bacterium]
MADPSLARGSRDIPLLTQTIGQALAATVQRFPDHEALVVCQQDVRLTYRQLDEQVEELARALMSTGLSVGDRLGIWSPNHAEWVLTQLATARIGVVLVCIKPAYRTTELTYALRQSGCRALIAAST